MKAGGRPFGTATAVVGTFDSWEEKKKRFPFLSLSYPVTRVAFFRLVIPFAKGIEEAFFFL